VEKKVLGENLAPVPLCPPQIGRPDPGSNLCRSGGKPATNRLSCGTANYARNFDSFLRTQTSQSTDTNNGARCCLPILSSHGGREVTPCIPIGKYRRFLATCCLQLEDWGSRFLGKAGIHQIARRHIMEGLPEH
jgi:hypothetical protein